MLLFAPVASQHLGWLASMQTSIWDTKEGIRHAESGTISCSVRKAVLG